MNKRFIIIISFSLLLLGLLSMEYYIFLGVVILLMLLFYLIFNLNNIKCFFLKLWNDCKRIHKRDHYRILEVDKITDRYNRILLLCDFKKIGYVIYTIFLISTFFALKSNGGANKESIITNIMYLFVWLMVIIITMFFLYYCFIRFPLMTYIFIPLISFIVYENVFKYYISLSISYHFIGYLLIVFLIYLIFSFVNPIYCLHKISLKTVIICSIVTISITIFTLMIPYLAEEIIRSNNIALNYENLSSNFSPKLISLFNENSILIEAFDFFIKDHFNNELIKPISIIFNGCSLSYIIGGLIIGSRVSLKKSKAKKLFLKILGSSTPLYDDIVKCCYMGGDEFEKLLLVNEKSKKVIFANENLPVHEKFEIKYIKKWILDFLWI